MKKLSKLLIGTGAFLFLQAMTIGLADSSEMVVTGANDPAKDVKAVQDALDKGGTVLLKGKFNFGEKAQVKITKDVTIHGEKDQKGVPVTEVRGGFLTFSSPLPVQLPVQNPGPKISIKDLHFDGAEWAPISIAYSSQTTITGNKMTNIKPHIGSMAVFGRKDLYRQQGIAICPRYGGAQGYLPGAVTGDILISDNDIDLTCDDPEKTMAQGIVIVETTGVDAQILRNRVINCSRNSLESLDNMPGQGGIGMTLIKDNKIVTATKGAPVPTPATPNGIIVGWFLDLSGASDPARRTTIVITGNQIETRGETSVAIAAIIDEAIVTSNHIILQGPQAQAIAAWCSKSLIVNNRIEGTGKCGVACVPAKDLKCSQNIVAENDFSLLKASMADVLFKGSGNILLGKHGKVIDEGQGNKTIE